MHGKRDVLGNVSKVSYVFCSFELSLIYHWYWFPTIIYCIHIISDAPSFSHTFLLFSLFAHWFTCTSYLRVFLDEREIGEDEGVTKEIESESKSEEQPPQEEEEEEESVPEQEAEKEPEQSHSDHCETESQPL